MLILTSFSKKLLKIRNFLFDALFLAACRQKINNCHQNNLFFYNKAYIFAGI
jgi:hypothetical protein